MVYFTCGKCGEPLKKPQVEKHVNTRCRSCEVLTCMDCMKEFYGDDYKSHTQCMSEQQRYSKEGRAGWDPSVGQGNKGEIKQMAWIEAVKSLVKDSKNLEPDVKQILYKIQDHGNIPRKKVKFVNFVKNIMGHKASPSSVDKVWELFSQAQKPAAAAPPVSEPATKDEEPDCPESDEPKKKGKKKKKAKDAEAGASMDTEEDAAVTESDKKAKKKSKKDKQNNKENCDKATELPTEPAPLPKKSKKRKREEREVAAAAAGADETPMKKAKFDYDQIVTSLLEGREDKEMSLKKLKKKVVAEFFAQNEGTHKTKEEVLVKLDKKLKKRKYRLLKDKVKLVSREEPDQSQESAESMEVEEPAEKASPGLSFNNWESANLGSSAQNQKFLRLMGVKNGTNKQVGRQQQQSRDNAKMFRDLENSFEKARQTHFSSRGQGLGFSE